MAYICGEVRIIVWELERERDRVKFCASVRQKVLESESEREKKCHKKM